MDQGNDPRSRDKIRPIGNPLREAAFEPLDQCGWGQSAQFHGHIHVCSDAHGPVRDRSLRSEHVSAYPEALECVRQIGE